MENKEEKEQQRQQSGFVIKIPSHQEILETSQSKTNPPSLFKPSPSFTQSFNFIKSSEFYAPPPPPPSLSSSSFSQPHTVPLPSAVAGSSSSSSTLSAPNRNAILVSHRCVDVMHSQHAKKLQEHRAHNRFGKNISQSETDSQTESLASPQCFHPTSPLRRTCPAQHALFYPVGQIKGNPLLKYIWNVRWAFADIICDYLLGQNSCALYLSLRYHLLHPDYLYYRIRELQKKFKLCVVLCHVDVEDVVKPLLEVTKTALLHDCTLLCGWSLEECGRYLETIKVYENKPADIIQGQMYTDYLSRLTHALTTVRHVNNTDVVTLGSTFGTLSHIMDASMEDLARCPGIGERKVKHLYDTFHEPFKHVMPKHPSATEGDPSTVSEGKKDEKEVECANKRNKKEPELTVKSALSAAFARYKEKVGEKNSKPLGVKGPEESAPGEANTAD